jgi:phosphoribosyl-AMP cyclohydrolase
MDKEYTDELMLEFGSDESLLIPVITQDFITREVLILAYANKAAYEETRRSGYATFYSRSRQEIWKKGVTSGNLLSIKEIRINCEQNSLLFLVIPEGEGACHAERSDGKPYSSCYYRRINQEGRLELTEK